MLYRIISFQIDEKCNVQDEAAKFVVALRRLNAFKHVRSIKISGEWGTYEARGIRYPERGYLLWKTNLDTENFTGSTTRTRRWRWNADFAPASKIHEDDTLWQPLADLLGKLQGLKDLVYDCPY